jgi:hypothetical protein
MRDFKAGRDINVEGDVHINDNSTQPKLFVVCTNEELLEERDHRKALLSQERKAKWKRLALAWLGVAIVLGVASIWLYFDGKKDLSSLLLGLGSFAVGLASIKVLEKPNLFEQRQIAALNEIRLILRERGAKD